MGWVLSLKIREFVKMGLNYLPVTVSHYDRTPSPTVPHLDPMSKGGKYFKVKMILVE